MILYIKYHHFILLWLNPFKLSVDREEWWFDDFVSYVQVWVSVIGSLKTFPSPGYTWKSQVFFQTASGYVFVLQTLNRIFWGRGSPKA